MTDPVLPKPGSPGSHVVHRRVEFRDTDAAGIAHFSAFFVWLESAEHEVLRRAGIRLVDHPDGPAGDTFSWPRVSAACDYRSAVRFNDELDIAVAVEAIGRSSVTWIFDFRHGGREVARGRVVAVHCRIGPGAAPVPVPIPDGVRARLAACAAPSAGSGSGSGPGSAA